MYFLTDIFLAKRVMEINRLVTRFKTFFKNVRSTERTYFHLVSI